MNVQGRQLASAADLDNLWSTADGRDVLLGRCITEATVRNVIRLNALATDPPLPARIRRRSPLDHVSHSSVIRAPPLAYAFAASSRKSSRPERANAPSPARGRAR